MSALSLRASPSGVSARTAAAAPRVPVVAARRAPVPAAAPSQAARRAARSTPRRPMAIATDFDPTATVPDASGRFGRFGGRYVPETLVSALKELDVAYKEAFADPEFMANFRHLLKDYVGRPSPLYHAERLSSHYARPGQAPPKIYLKREDLNHTGAHKINNALGQVLLAQRMGKTRIIAETGAGQHGVATATACARAGLECVVYMGSKDMERQALNVYRMRLLGAEVVGVPAGTATLKDACSEALRDWVSSVEHTHYVLGSAAGPHPFPALVRDLQAVIGDEARAQILEAEGRLPDVCMACVGGGSNAIGLFNRFIADLGVRLIGVEAGGYGVETDKHAATISKGSPGVLHGAFSYLIQTEDGQIVDPHSISAGLDYPGVGPEHSWLADVGRAEYVPATDGEALDAFQLLCKLEGIIPALESSHALAHLEKLAPTLEPGAIVIVNLSGRGDKDVQQVQAMLEKGSSH